MEKKIMVFDDDADILEICRYILEAKGYDVATRQSCTEVISDLEGFHPDLVVMDNWIPDIGGVKATQLIKAHSRFNRVPVVLFTASKDIQKLAREATADAFIEKPFNIETLEETVSRLLNP